MKKILLTLALLFSVSSVHASGDWKDWYSNTLKGLKAKVESRFQSKNRVSAVAAVRGSKQGSDAKALYWKGGVSEAARKKLEAERKQLTDALQLVLDGSLPQGKTAIEKFMKDNPDSVYLPEAKEALEKLPADEAKPAAAQPAKDAPAQQKEGSAAQPKEEKPASKKAPAGSGN
jgi:hypothetical protein